MDEADDGEAHGAGWGPKCAGGTTRPRQIVREDWQAVHDFRRWGEWSVAVIVAVRLRFVGRQFNRTYMLWNSGPSVAD